MLRTRVAPWTVAFAALLAACGSASSSPSSGTAAGDDGGAGGGSSNGSTSPGAEAGAANAPDADPGQGTGMGTGQPASPPVTAAKTYVVLGDSISAGGGIGPFYYDLLTTNDDTKYPEWKGKDFKTRFGSSLKVVSTAKAGAVSSDLAGQVTALPSSLDGPVVVTITMGGNDMQGNIASILQGTDQNVRTQFGTNLATALSQLTMPGRFGAGVEVRVFEADIYDPTDGTGNFSSCPFPLDLVNQPTDTFFGNWNAVAQAEIPKHGESVVAHLHATFRGHGVTSGSLNWFNTDCVHPNAEGHDAIRGMFWTAVTGEVGPHPM